MTILSRATSSAAFPTGTTVKKVDYEDEAALVEAFTGQDAVISTLTAQFVASQTKLIDAAAKAGVKRFIPSDVSEISVIHMQLVTLLYRYHSVRLGRNEPKSSGICPFPQGQS